MRCMLEKAETLRPLPKIAKVVASGSTRGYTRGMEFHDLHTAWRWLQNHSRIKYMLSDYLYIMVAKIDPITRKIEDDPARNTETEVWVECCVTDPQEGRILDHDLDCGAPTFEGAICRLATLVHEKYGAK